MKNQNKSFTKNLLLAKRFIFVVLLAVFLTHLVFRIYNYSDRYKSKFDPAYWKARYLQSQWIDPLSKNPIGDDGLYTYAAWEYINGADPTLINAEMPFLGKYLLGLFIFVFNNENIFALVTGFLVLWVYYIFNLMVFKNWLIAFIPVFVFSFDRLFYEQIRAPFFDSLALLFLFLIFLCFLKRKMILSLVFLGLFAASKFPFMAILPVIAIILSLLLLKKYIQLGIYLLALPVSFIVYALTYLRYFQLGNPFFDFLSVQKYIFNFYITGAKNPFIANVVPMFLFGKWYTHFQTVTKISEWSFLWPITLLLAVFSFIFRKFYDLNILLILNWVVIYSLFLCFTPVFPRYLLLLLPFLYNLAVWFLSKSTPKKLQLLFS